MAHNPKLQIFKISLNPRAKTKDACYRNFFRDKCFETQEETDKLTDAQIFKAYHQAFIKGIDVTDFYFFKDEKNKKAITINDTNAIKKHDSDNIIEGIIKGGRYDQEREKVNMSNKKVDKVKKDDIILDQFYFLIYTPLKSSTGILFLQSYTEDSICDVFCKFIKSFFTYGDNYFDIRIESYMPQNLKEEYKKKAKLKGFSFSTKEIIGIVGEGVTVKEQEEFSVTINIQPIQRSNLHSITNKVEKLLHLRFHNKELSQFSKRVYLEDDQNKAAYYDLEKDVNHIRPTIYLENKIYIHPENGLPDFDELKDFCMSQLKIIIQELDKARIHEAAVIS